jgi:probable F420-dependent oxidoreductase
LGLAFEGRIELGLGAGWQPSDYERVGVPFEGASTRVARLAESLAIISSLLSDGTANFEGAHYSVRDARCELRPRTTPRVIVGGGSRRVLTLAAQRADTVNVNTSLAAGEAVGDIASQATFDHYDQCSAWVRDAAGDGFTSLEMQITAVAALVVSSRRAALRSATMLGFPGEDVLDLPVFLIGTEDELCERLIERRERWGFSSIVVPDHAMHTFSPVVARLSGS